MVRAFRVLRFIRFSSFDLSSSTSSSEAPHHSLPPSRVPLTTLITPERANPLSQTWSLTLCPSAALTLSEFADISLGLDSTPRCEYRIPELSARGPL